jgi:DNA-binding SARP family transcriptional activator/tetratricopeptide (TPR) repeat protein
VPTPSLLLELTQLPQAQVADRRWVLSLNDALLLAWLALEGPSSRERLAHLLWPASDAESARNALRQRLFRLRKQVGEDIVCGSTVLALADGVSHDLRGADTDFGLLGDLVPSDAPELATWLAAHRTSRRAKASHAVEARIDTLEAQGSAADLAQALALAVAWLRGDKLSEDAHRRVIRLHYLRGDRAAALLAFDHCEQVLKDEVGAAPSRLTLELLATVESAGAAPVKPADWVPAVPARGAQPGDARTSASASASDPASVTATPFNAPPRNAAVPAAVLRPPRLIGRDAELGALRRGLAAGQVVVLLGEAGMGKSRLLQSLAAEAPGVLHVSSRPGDSLVPYASLSRTLRKIIDRAPEALDDPLRHALAPLLPQSINTRQLAADAALFDHALAGLAGQAEASLITSPPPAPSARTALAWPVQTLLQRAAQRVPTLALDDLHFADDATLDLLQSLLAAPRDGAAQSTQSTRWCLGTRPPSPGSRLAGLLAALATAGPHTRLRLQPLTETQMAELVDSLALPGTSSAGLAPALHQRTGGNPLFALETLKLAWHEGSMTRPAELPRPDSLAQLIGQQLARLSASALQLARVAAVAGVGFSIPLAETLLGRSALELADSWAELEAQQVLRGDAFAHDLVHDAVLQGLPAVIARHLHGQAAAWLERQGGEPAHIAAHWEAAGQPLRALPALRAAAHRAHQALREGERIAFLLRAADIAQTQREPARQDEAFDLVRSAVEGHMNTIRQADGLPLLDRLQALARTPRQQAYAAGDRAWYSAVLGDFAAAVEQGEAALALAQRLGSAAAPGPGPAPQGTAPGAEVLLASIQQRLGTALSMAGRFDEALHHMQAAAPAIEAHASGDALGEFHGNLAVVLNNLGRPAQAQPHYDRALALSLDHGDQSQRATVLANYAASRLDAGDAAGASALMAQAQDIVKTFELAGSSAGFIALLQAQCARAVGHYGAALAGCEHAAAILAERNPARVPVARLLQAQVWLDLGQHARALQLLGASHSATLAAAQALPARYAVRWLLLAAQLQKRLHGGAGAWPLSAPAAPSVHGLLAEAAARAPNTGWPELGLLVRTEQALLLPPEEALVALNIVVGQAQAHQLHGAALGALLHACQRASAPHAATALADAVLALLPTTEALHTDRALRWLAPAQALTCGPGPTAVQALARAKACVHAGQTWLKHTAAQVAPEFKHGLLHQNPHNAALMAWHAAA